MKQMFNALLRMTSLAISATAALLFAGPANAQEEEKILNIYNWSDYIAEDTIANFEKETGIKVRYDVFDSNEILHAKLVAGKTGYDVVVPSSYWAKIQADGGLLRKLDKAALPNLKNMDPVIQTQLAALDPGNQYLVNWLWGFTTVGINVDKVKAALGGMPMPANAWDLIFKPEYISKLKSCGVSFLDSATDTIPAALHYLGKPAFSRNQSDYAGVAPLLKSVRSSVTLFSSSGYINDLASGQLCAVMGYSGDINIARARALEAAPKAAAAVEALWPQNAPMNGLVVTRYDYVPPDFAAAQQVAAGQVHQRIAHLRHALMDPQDAAVGRLDALALERPLATHGEPRHAPKPAPRDVADRRHGSVVLRVGRERLRERRRPGVGGIAPQPARLPVRARRHQCLRTITSICAIASPAVWSRTMLAAVARSQPAEAGHRPRFFKLS